ncbi:MAG: hypothetical protein H0W08_05365 [Acidobacteria bacterium]|nr:hypothetical protein [Acidobacteriota bacterium]
MIQAAEALLHRVRDGVREDDWSATDGPHNLVGRASTRSALAALALFAALTVLHTWPLASALGTLSRHDNADAVLNEWALAWVAHQLPRDPLHLFDANIFYPEVNTLAFSEHLALQGAMGAPLFWAGVPSLVVHNLLVLVGFALTGWTMALVLRRRTGSWSCGILAGMLLAFNSHSLSRIAHLQAVHVEFLPLAIMALDRLLTRPTAANALKLSLAYALQSLTSNYFLVFMTFGLAGAGIVRWKDWIGEGRIRVFALVCLSAVVAVLMLAPFLIPYLQAQQNQGLTRSLEEVAKYSASWQDYLSATGNLHYRTWSAPLWRRLGAPLFPGVTALLLAALACASGVAWKHRAARTWLAVGVVGFVLSFGAALPGYAFLYHAVPLLQGIRASVRFGYLALAAVAALAAFGLSLLRAKYERRPAVRRALTVGALVLVTVEALRIPVGYSTPHATPSVYQVLTLEPNAVLVELPLYEPRAFQLNALYMLHSTVHWRPILNGYSGFRPASYVRHYERLIGFPDASSLAYLREIGVTHVAVHANAFAEKAGHERLQAIAATPGLRVAITSPNLTIYKVRSADR